MCDGASGGENYVILRTESTVCCSESGLAGVSKDERRQDRGVMDMRRDGLAEGFTSGGGKVSGCFRFFRAAGVGTT